MKCGETQQKGYAKAVKTILFPHGNRLSGPKATDESGAEYTDEVEIGAGWETTAI